MEKLPFIVIEGTTFQVDVKAQELREQANPQNVISFLEMIDHGTYYAFLYDPKEKNLQGLSGDGIEVEIPSMGKLDPEGMAEAFGKDINWLAGKADYEIIVDQELVHLRENGVLPIIEIVEHPFFVDIRAGSLRPKDDFRTMGIQFSDIQGCLMWDGENYGITYDPKSHKYVEIDYRNITAIPKDIVVVEIPYEARLDPIGYARKYDLDKKQVLKAYPPRANMKARIIPWSETSIEQIIKSNLKQAERKSISTAERRQPGKRRGNRL